MEKLLEVFRSVETKKNIIAMKIKTYCNNLSISSFFQIAHDDVPSSHINALNFFSA